MKKLLLFVSILFFGACTANENIETESQQKKSYDFTTKSTDTDDAIKSVKVILYQDGVYIKSVDFKDGEKLALKGLNESPYQIYAIANYSEMEEGDIMPLGLSLVPGEPLIGCAYLQNADLMPDLLVAKRDFDPKTQNGAIELNFKRIVGKLTITIKNAEELYNDDVEAIYCNAFQFPNLIDFDALDMNSERGYNVSYEYYSDLDEDENTTQSTYVFPSKSLNGSILEPNVVLCEITLRTKSGEHYRYGRHYSKNPLRSNEHLELAFTLNLPEDKELDEILPAPNRPDSTKTKSFSVNSLNLQVEEIVHSL